MMPYDFMNSITFQSYLDSERGAYACAHAHDHRTRSLVVFFTVLPVFFLCVDYEYWSSHDENHASLWFFSIRKINSCISLRFHHTIFKNEKKKPQMEDAHGHWRFCKHLYLLRVSLISVDLTLFFVSSLHQFHHCKSFKDADSKTKNRKCESWIAVNRLLRIRICWIWIWIRCLKFEKKHTKQPHEFRSWIDYLCVDVAKMEEKKAAIA